MLQDLLYALRSLRRAPAYALMVVLTLALGIGANTAIFNVAWQVLLEPLPFPDEDRLVLVWEGFGREREANPAAPASYLDWRREARSFESIAAFSQYESVFNLTGAGEPREIEVTHVTEDFFNVLGVTAIAGRTILPADGASQARLLVLTERVWRQDFGQDGAVIGRTVRLHGEPYEIIGVVADHASLGTNAADAWTLLTFTSADERLRQAHYLQVVARLRPGVSIARADDEVRRISERSFGEFGGPGVAESGRVVSLREQMIGSLRPVVLILVAGAGLVLLIAGANIGGLHLARHTGRRRDLAIHAALGASGARQVRQHLAEALVLAVPAGYAGLIIGVWVLSAISASAPPLADFHLRTRPDLVVILYTFALSVLAALASGLAISVRSGVGLQPLLSSRGASTDRTGGRLRQLLVSAQVALSVIVLIGASLLVSSLWKVLHVDPGYTFESGLVIDVDLPESDYPDAAARSRFFDLALERVEAVPGTFGACAMTVAPLVPRLGSMTWVPEGTDRMVSSEPTAISPRCFEVLGIPVLRGRGFNRIETESVGIVSAGLARQLFGDADPIGRRVHMGLPDGELLTIVGVVGNIRRSSLESSFARQMWLPSSSRWYPPRQLVVRTSVPAASLTEAIRGRIREIDPKLPVSRIETMAGIKRAGLADRRFSMLLLMTYGLVGLLLCAVGIYGLLAQTVGQRTREIGIRMALGARGSDVVRHVVLGTALTVVAGCLAGAAGAMLLTRFVEHMLFGIRPTEPAVYAGVLGIVLLVTFVAAYLPARRATRIDPLEALRAE